eukprot:1161331-Pelagomonas_calceolata.AAC.9
MGCFVLKLVEERWSFRPALIDWRKLPSLHKSNTSELGNTPFRSCDGAGDAESLKLCAQRVFTEGAMNECCGAVYKCLDPAVEKRACDTAPPSPPVSISSSPKAVFRGSLLRHLSGQCNSLLVPVSKGCISKGPKAFANLYSAVA